MNRVLPNIEKILSLLEDCGVKATFFVLGSVAESNPGIAAMIAGAGHEVASHGYSHRLVPEIGEKEFENEIRRTGAIIESQTGIRPVGYRAPQWSLKSSFSWAFQLLHDLGYLYDSSLNPLPFVGDRRGSRTPYKVQTGSGSILEVPPMVTPSPFFNLPTGGGWGFRVFPASMIKRTIRNLNQNGNPAVLYLHPREMEAATGPRLELPPFAGFAVYGPRRNAGDRLRCLLKSFRFDTMKNLVEARRYM